MKAKIFLFVLVIFFTGANLVFAQANFSTARKDGSSWTEASTFSLSEKPWLHINVPDTSFYNDWTLSFWNYPAPGSSYFLSNQVSAYAEYVKEGTSDLYLSFNDVVWPGIAKSGVWDISASTVLFKSTGAPYFGTTLKSYDGSTSFNITPEPVSCALFLLGGGTLAVAGRFRKKARVNA